MKSPPLIVLGFMLFILTFLFVGMPVPRPVEPPVQEKDGSGPAEVKPVGSKRAGVSTLHLRPAAEP